MQFDDSDELAHLFIDLARDAQTITERCVEAVEQLKDPYSGVDPLTIDLDDAVGFVEVPDTFPADWCA